MNEHQENVAIDEAHRLYNSLTIEKRNEWLLRELVDLRAKIMKLEAEMKEVKKGKT